MMKRRWMAGAAALWLGIAPAASAQAQAVTVPRAEMEKLLETYALIKRNYVAQADDGKLFEGAIAGMLASLDAHSEYMNKDAMREIDRESTGSYVGIGIEVEDEHGQLRVVSTTPQAPADKAGIQAGDLLVSIDGAPATGLPSSEAARRMHGAAGSVVTVAVARRGKLRSLRLTRVAMHNDTVRMSMTAAGLPWIRIAEFGSATGADLAAVLKKLDAQAAPRGIVLDLRNDGGGLVSAAVAVGGAFLPAGATMFTARGRDADTEAKVTVDPRYYREADTADVLAGLPAWTRTVPLTVLVNGASASAAELLAGALQDNRRATIVGSQTFGKGSIQSVIPLDAEDGIKFTVARYFTPGGHEIQAHGVTPDLVVRPAAGADEDWQLREADLANHLAPRSPRQMTRRRAPCPKAPACSARATTRRCRPRSDCWRRAQNRERRWPACCASGRRWPKAMRRAPAARPESNACHIPAAEYASLPGKGAGGSAALPAPAVGKDTGTNSTRHAPMWQDESTKEDALDTQLHTLLADLAAFGDAHDGDAANRATRMLNITPDTGEFLAVLVKAMGARRILEIGTSNGYSTLWLADAVASIDGDVTTIEMSLQKVAMAKQNFERAGLDDRITQREGDAGGHLAKFGDGEFDLVFLDSQRSAYLAWWPDLKRILRAGGLLVVDNATSHAEEMAAFTETVRADQSFTTSLVPVGKGEFLAVKA
ncbi:S41 family peptidase [Massilia aerilata]|uniref:S41 family peptidase n=1 Tax=Massilia aerilata TaxID=453817 RepID=A0ABW0S0A3_9BURK